MEFASRRNHLQSTAKESRPQFIMENYPCFKHPSEVYKVQAVLFYLRDVVTRRMHTFLLHLDC